jgi:hypothetical protein
MHLITNKLEVKSDDFFVERELDIFSGVEYIPFRSADFIAELDRPNLCIPDLIRGDREIKPILQSGRGGSY